MLYQLEDDSPIVLVVSELNLALTNLVVNTLEDNSFRVKLINLDQDFFLDQEKVDLQQKRVHKIIFIYGFNSVSTEVYQRVFAFFDHLNQKQTEMIPIVLISTVSTSLEILDDFNLKYQSYLNDHLTFLNDFFNHFSQSLVFLAKDLLIENNKNINYPLLLLFSAIKQGYLFDPQSKFYFQDEKSFFQLIKSYLIKPHSLAKYIINGQAISSEKIVKDILYLYEQYFQKKLSVIKLLAEEKKEQLFEEFSLVSNKKVKIENLLDQRIREINKFNQEIAEIAPSELELKKALAMEFLEKKQKSLKPKIVKNINHLSVLHQSPVLFKQAQKKLNQTAKEANFSFELLNKIEQLFSTQRNQEKILRQEKNLDEGKKIILKSKKRKILFYLGVFGFSVGLILLTLLLLFNLSQKELQKQLLNSVKNEGQNIEKIDKSGIYKLFVFQLQQYQKILLEESLTQAHDIKTLNDSLLSLFKNKAKSNQLIYNLYLKTFTGGAEMSYFYNDLLPVLDQKIEAQKAFNAYLSSLNLDLYEETEKNIWQKALDQSREELKNFLQLRRFIEVFKDFILQSGRVNFLILIQDSNELRATGGLLTQAIILSFDQAVLVDKQTFNVDELDARVYGHKDSDSEIAEFLNQKTFHLRDSNWWADFFKTSHETKWFIEQATGLKIDLVIALNTKTIDELYRIFNNNHLEIKNQADYLLENLLKLNAEQFLFVGDLWLKHLNQREIFLESSNPDLERILEINSWSGQIIKPVCPAEFKQENCLLDYFFQVENNIGLNKSNAYLRETIEHNIGISQEFIRHKRKIIYENLSRGENNEAGFYRSYLKFYLNNQANLEKVEINGRQLDLQKVTIKEGDFAKEIIVPFLIPKQSKLELTITYLVTNQMELPFSYVFFDQKQAGIFAKETNYNIVFDEKLKPQLIAPQAVYQDKIIRFKNNNQDHFLFAIKFNN